MAEVTEPVLMENVSIIFRNFAGKEGPYNVAGDRNFAVVLDPAVAEVMAADDWNVKVWTPKAEDGEEVDEITYLPVAVSYKGRPPRVVLVTSGGRTNLGEDEIEMLDWADIINVDLIVNPYHWNVTGKSGIKAYLQSMFVTIQEDPLEKKYNELDRANSL